MTGVETRGPERVVRARTGGHHFGLAARDVREVVAVGRCTRLPGAPAFVRGLMAVRGVPLPVVDLAAALGHAPSQAPDAWVLLVQAAGRRFGVLVDDVDGVLGAAAAGHGGPSAHVVGHSDGPIVLAVDLSHLATAVFVAAAGGDHPAGEERTS